MQGPTVQLMQLCLLPYCMDLHSTVSLRVSRVCRCCELRLRPTARYRLTETNSLVPADCGMVYYYYYTPPQMQSTV